MLDKGSLKDLIATCTKWLEKRILPISRMRSRISASNTHPLRHSLAVSDISVPANKATIIDQALQTEETVQRDFRRGLLTEQERNERVIEIWQQTTNTVAHEVKKSDGSRMETWLRKAISGATKAGFAQFRSGRHCAGLMAIHRDVSSRCQSLELPRRSERPGILHLTHGARKGLADTALRTADAGYLTRAW